MATTGFIIASLLPWLAGTGLAYLCLPRGRTGTLALALGYGYPLGMLLVIGLLLVFEGLGLTLAALPLAAALVPFAAGFALAAYRRRHESSGPDGPVLSGTAAQTLTALLLILVLARIGLFAAELLSRPLYAWDAWMNWAPKAVVWFHEQRLVPFVPPGEWLAAAPDSGVYTLGNRAASAYPPGVPLIILWHMLAAGSAESSLAFLPWALLLLAMGAACWGYLRGLGAAPVTAAAAAFGLVSLPLLNVHVAHAGYADLWLAGYFGLAALALAGWARDRTPGLLALVLLLALGAALVKKPGLAFAAVIVLLAAARALGWSLRTWVTLLLASGLAAISLFVFRLEIPLPGGASLGFDGTFLRLPYLGSLRLSAHPLLPILGENLFFSANWHLLWPALLLAIAASCIRRRRAVVGDALLQAIIVALALLYFVFGFTQYFDQAANLLTLSRTLLYPALPAVVFCLREFDAWWKNPSASE
ncbi:hypothetical protein [Pseudohaliea sp.]|uniref:hypothetical protein n=1 Tax=Pseudohaliea sp. TaxID=2740289 RepID=UPI0032EF61DB